MGSSTGATWVAVLAGLLWLWRCLKGAGPRPWTTLIGPMLAGWGIFDLIEGIVDHHLLGVHHVRSGPYQLWWDLAFLGFGAVLVAAGTLLYRRSPRHPE